MTQKYDFLVFVGRMQPPHKAHIEIIKRALTLSKHVIVLIGSANMPRTIKNPWTWQERKEMITACLTKDEVARTFFSGINDSYSDQDWIRDVQSSVDMATMGYENPQIRMIGHEKDASSYYLNLFPQWGDIIAVENMYGVNSTQIRQQMFELEQIDTTHIPDQVVDMLEAFMNTNHFAILKEEYDYIQKYQLSWAKAPYPPTFVTVDAVVVQSGHVLLVRRRAAPGFGLWAMPGGFLGQNERIEDSMIRELREETKLKVAVPVLKGSIKSSKVFDNPNRSFRGRTITHVFGISLAPGPLPKVKGSDDADKAKWIPLSVFDKMQNQMFEDHFFIVQDILGDLKK